MKAPIRLMLCVGAIGLFAAACSAQASLVETDSAGLASICRSVGVNTVGDIHIELSLLSEIDAPRDVAVRYLLSNDGTDLAESEATIQELRVDEQVRMIFDSLTDAPNGDPNADITCEVIEVVALDVDEDVAQTQPAAADSCDIVPSEESDEIQIELVIANPFESSAELLIDYALVSSDGIRFADGIAFALLDEGDAGEITVRHDTFATLPEWVPADTPACEVLSLRG